MNLKDQLAQLQLEKSTADHRIESLRNTIAGLEQERAHWRDQRAQKELELRQQLMHSAAQLIDSLARAMGGPGF